MLDLTRLTLHPGAFLMGALFGWLVATAIIIACIFTPFRNRRFR